MDGRVLISGAGVAGPALAYWLHRFGLHPMVVERAPALRRGGQAVDVRGVAVDVVKHMDLYEAAYDLRTHMRGASALDGEGQEIWRSEDRSFSGGRFDSGDIEIFRDDLMRLLYAATAGYTEYCWGDSVTSVEQQGGSACVSFERQGTREFDLVVGADGLHSQVRRLVFGEETPYVQSLGIGVAIFSTPNLLDLRDWQLSFRDETSGYVIYPNRDNTELRVNLGFTEDRAETWRIGVNAQKALVATKCKHLKWKIPRLVEAMWGAADFYFGDIALVRLAPWSRDRTVLLGDAAYGPSPFSGQGTSLALVGAYVLAEELQRAPTQVTAALDRYESRMRPFVELNQALVNMKRAGPVPDDEMDRAKNGIVLDSLSDAAVK